MAIRIPENVIEDIRTSINIVDVISSYVQLEKKGQNLFGICPFQDEKTPSLSVSESKQIFHCFSCGRGGNVFRFLMDIDNLNFLDAVKKIASDTNISLDKYDLRTKETKRYSEKQQKLINLSYDAEQLFQHVLLTTDMGKEARNYLDERSITKQDIDDFKIGYAPDENVLYDFLIGKKYTDDELKDSGLFVESSGKLKDRFFKRLIFPVHNQFGDTVGFSGRSLSVNSNQAKYLNSPETLIFKKDQLLYNLYQAKNNVRPNNELILFEGFMDVIAAHRAGIKNGISSMGTSLTRNQVGLIQKTVHNVKICYDGDSAGQKATDRAIEIIETTSKLELKIISIPDKQDPDEYADKYGSEGLEKLLKQSGITSTAFYLAYDQSGLNLDQPGDQVTYIDKSLDHIARLNNDVEREVYLKQLAKDLELNLDDLKKQLKDKILTSKKTINRSQSSKQGVQSNNENRIIKKTINKFELAQQILLVQALNNYKIWIKLQNIPDFFFPSEMYQTIYMLFEGYLSNHETYNPAEFINYLKEDNLQKEVANLELLDIDRNMSDDAINDCIKLIQEVEPINNDIVRIKKELQEAVKLGNTNKEEELTIQLITLYKKQQDINS